MSLLAIVDRLNVLRISSFSPDGLTLQFEAPGVRWPAWLPRSTRLLHSTPAGEGAAVLVRDVATSAEPPVTIFRNDTGVTAALGPGTPHYASPSPDGKWAAIVAPGADTLALSIVNTATGSVAARIPGAPIFSAWSTDSRLLAVHSGSDLLVVDIASGESRTVVTSDAIGFRTPAVGPAGELAYVGRSGRLLTLGWGMMDASGWAPGPVTRGGAVGLFRPGTNELWLASAPMGNTGLLSRLSFAHHQETTTIDAYRGPFAAFSWSPSGRSLVIAVPRQPADDRTALVALDASGAILGESETFLPSDDQRALWSFFDQYSHSHGSWLVTGDDEYFAFSGRHGTDRVSPSFGSSEGNRILLWRPARHEPLIDLCPGELAVPAPASVAL